MRRAWTLTSNIEKWCNLFRELWPTDSYWTFFEFSTSFNQKCWTAEFHPLNLCACAIIKSTCFTIQNIAYSFINTSIVRVDEILLVKIFISCVSAQTKHIRHLKKKMFRVPQLKHILLRDKLHIGLEISRD